MKRMEIFVIERFSIDLAIFDVLWLYCFSISSVMIAVRVLTFERRLLEFFGIDQAYFSIKLTQPSLE